jgi:hypothetical protein
MILLPTREISLPDSTLFQNRIVEEVGNDEQEANTKYTPSTVVAIHFTGASPSGLVRLVRCIAYDIVVFRHDLCIGCANKIFFT